MTPKQLTYDSARIAAWVLERVDPHSERWEKLYQGIGLELDGQLVAGCVFCQYVPGVALTVHLAATPGMPWAARWVLKAGFRYAFSTCDVGRLTAYVAATNWRCHRLLLSLGFEHEGTLKKGVFDGDERVYGLLREQCRFL